MGRPRKNLILPTYASEFRDRHGKARIRLRRTGWHTIYVSERPGSVEFTQAYKTWEATQGTAAQPGRAIPGTFDALIADFYRSEVWHDLRESTREVYRGQFERFRTSYGSRRVATMTPKHVRNLIYMMRETPTAANNLRKRLKQLFDFAVIEKYRPDNPTIVIRSLRTREGGHPTWSERDIARYEAYHPIGSSARLAFDLALYTAQRRSDVHAMGPSQIEGNKIWVKQLKTGKELLIPIHTALARSLAATPTGEEKFVLSSRDENFTEDSFGMWFKKKCREAGITDRSMHGLRKAAARRMAELGLSNQIIKSITGHTSDAEVARYTREAEQKKMAELAMQALELG